MIGKYSNHSSTDGIIDNTIVLLQLSGPKNTMEMESINESVPQMEPHLKKREEGDETPQYSFENCLFGINVKKESLSKKGNDVRTKYNVSKRPKP